MAKEEAIALLKKYIEVLNKEGISVVKAFLYGSYAEDTANIDSDIDVMLVSNLYNENDDKIIGKIWSLTRKVNTKIEPFLIGEKSFNKGYFSPLINDVKSRGTRVYPN
ncbi:MAG: nucleotidyltransferase domain-containing protein [Chitinophagales bacterium]